MKAQTGLSVHSLFDTVLFLEGHSPQAVVEA
jgi:hypothetical protein